MRLRPHFRPILVAADGVRLPNVSTLMNAGQLPGESYEQWQARIAQRSAGSGAADGFGNVAGVLGGVGVAAAGLTQAAAMPTTGVDAQQAQLNSVAKQEAQEKAISDGVATAASSFGPMGMAAGAALKLGGGISSALRNANKDEYGLQKTDGASVLRGTVAGMVDPLGATQQAISRWGDDDYSTGEKLLGSLPMTGALFTRAGTERKRKRIEEQMNAAAVSRSTFDNQKRNYAGVQYAAEGGPLRFRPFRKLAGGGKPRPAATEAAPAKTGPVPYSVENPSEQANQYYRNVGPAALDLLHNKHDETYRDPATGRTERANSCLSFANTCFEKATGTSAPRTRDTLYNPAFTANSAAQGWVRVPLSQARAGDRLQQWENAGNDENGRVIGKPEDQQARIKDLGANTYIPNAYPIHMTVIGSPMQPGAGGSYATSVYQDGHQFREADMAKLPNVSDKNYVAYRYVGVNGEPTNDPKKAVAVRKRGGRLPASVIAEGRLHSQKHQLNDLLKKPVTATGIPIISLTGGADNGEQVAELENNELTLSHETTKAVEGLLEQGKFEDAGRLFAEQVTTNTVPNRKYRPKLKFGGQVSALRDDNHKDKPMVMLNEDGSPQMFMKGEERIYSQPHTTETVDLSIKAKTPAAFRKIGRRLQAIHAGQDARASKSE